MKLVVLIPALQPYREENYYGVRALWARVIFRAIYDYVRLKDAKGLKARRELKAVERWLFRPSDLSNGLQNLCRVLGWPVDAVRSRAMEMSRQDIRRIVSNDRELTSGEQLGDS